MSMKKCPKCGELFSDSYTTCPYCVDDEEIRSIARASMQPRRVVIGAVCLLLVLCGAAYYFFGGALRSALAPSMPAPSSPLTDEIPMPEPTEETTEEPGEIVGGEDTSASAAYEVKKGDGLQMSLSNDAECVWTSSDPAVAKIDENGLLTALKAGTVTVTATMAGGGQVACTVTVTEPEPEPAAPASAVTGNTAGGTTAGNTTTGNTTTGNTTGSGNTGNSTGSGNTGNSTGGNTTAPSETNGGELNYGEGGTTGNSGNSGISQPAEGGYVIPGGGETETVGTGTGGFYIPPETPTVTPDDSNNYVIG